MSLGFASLSRLAPLEMSRLARLAPRETGDVAAGAAGDVATTALRGKQRGSRRYGIGSEWNGVLELGYFLSQWRCLQPRGAGRYFQPRRGAVSSETALISVSRMNE